MLYTHRVRTTGNGALPAVVYWSSGRDSAPEYTPKLGIAMKLVVELISNDADTTIQETNAQRVPPSNTYN